MLGHILTLNNTTLGNDKRLRMCKKYPASKIGYPGKLHEGCGYKVEDKSFDSYLK